MKIVTLLENTTCSEELACEHGLSLYIETGTHKILFDAGSTDAFAQNAEKLGIDLSQVDIAVLSHGHDDHGGGLGHFLKINQTAPVYIHEHAFRTHGNAVGKNIGLDPRLLDTGRVIPVGEHLAIDDGIVLYACNEKPRPFGTDSAGLTEEGKPDLFTHEQYLLIREGETTVLISGCSHKGILNIMQWFSPDILVGGFHFMKIDPEKQRDLLEHAAGKLLAHPTVYYTGHCTGGPQFAVMKEIMGSRLEAISTGRELYIP